MSLDWICGFGFYRESFLCSGFVIEKEVLCGGDDDADDEDEEESSNKEEEEEEHLALTVSALALHSSIPAFEDSDETEPFEEGKTAATPPAFRYRVAASNGIYEIDMHDLVPNDNSIYNVSTKRAKHNLDSNYLWHCRLAHISKKRIKKLQQEWLLKSTDDESFDQCVSCLSSKMTKKLFSHRPEMATDLLGITRIDVCGLLRHVSRQGASYFITFTDDYIQNQLGKTIKALRSDRGGEYISQEFKDYLKACGIVQQLTPPYTPQHNGVSERRNQSATRILNMVPTKKVDKTPYELWYEKVPNLSYLKVWGYEALVKRDTSDKLQQRSVKCIFIGYLKETMGYYFYFPPKNKIVVARYAKFFEKNLITQEVSGRAVDLEEIQDKDTSPFKNTSEIPMEVEGFKPPQEEVILIRRSVRTHQAPDRLCLNVKIEEHSLGDLNEPASYKAVKLDSESNKIYYEETFLPVTDIRAIRILISIAAFYDYEIWQMDVKTAFLNVYLDKDIYLKIDLNKTQGASTPKEVKRMQNVPYASAKGSIMYAVRRTRPDVAFAQNITSWFQQNPEMEAVWIRKFISRLGIVPIINEPIKMFCDNSAALLIAIEPGVQIGTRHYHRSNLLKVYTNDNMVAPFTKALSNTKITQHARSMGLRLASSFM
nr:hypothetical protein [Tanacetum cinerariifolium]